MIKPKILIVDDDQDLLALYKMFLEQKGLNEIELAYNGQDAILKYKSSIKKPSIIIMDHRMPGISGIDAMKKILEINNKTKVIFASADCIVKYEVISMSAYAFINKPFEMVELLYFIEQAIDSTNKNE